MTISEQSFTEPGRDELAEKARDHLWMHFTRHSVYYDGSGHVPVIVKGDGAYIWDDQGNKYFDGLSGLFVVQAGHGRKELAAAGGQAGRGAGVLPDLVVRPSEGHRAGRAPRAPGPRRPQPRVLHLRRRRGRRDRLEARQAVLQADRQADQAQGHQPEHRLPRHAAGRAVDHRHPRREDPVRAARARRRQGAQHQLLPGSRGVPARREGLRPVGGEPHRRGDRVRGARQRRGRLPRAGAELRRLLPAAARVPGARARDLRRVRRHHGRRRDDHVLRPHRRHLRDEPLRRDARHHHLRQGHDLRLRPDGRHDRERPPLRALQARARTRSSTATPGAATRWAPPWRWPTSTCSTARGSCRTSATTRAPSATRWRS